MNKQERREFLTVVTNDQIAERIIGMSFAEKRQHLIDWQWKVERVANGTHPVIPDFRTWLFDKAEQIILNERDRSYNESMEYMP